MAVRIAFIAIVTALLAIGLVKVSANMANKQNPPAECQLLGGVWDLWDGWQCNLNPLWTNP